MELTTFLEIICLQFGWVCYFSLFLFGEEGKTLIFGKINLM